MSVDCSIVLCLFAVAPVFVTVPRNQTVIFQSTVVWLCVVSANPSATITWTKDGEQLGGRTNIVISHDELKLTNVSRGDAGKYTCTASNDIGVVAVTVELEIHGKHRKLMKFDSVN